MEAANGTIYSPDASRVRTQKLSINTCLESESQTSLDGSRRLRKKQRISIRRQEWVISLCQQIRYVDRRVKSSRQQIAQPQRLPQIAAEVRLVPKRSIWIDCRYQSRRLPPVRRPNPGSTANHSTSQRHCRSLSNLGRQVRRHRWKAHHRAIPLRQTCTRG